jgi:hypothetical protein
MIPSPGMTERYVPAIATMGILAASRVGALIDSSLDVRGHLPNVIDAPNHIGNTAMTFVFMERMATAYWGKAPEALTPEAYNKRRRFVAATVGALTIAANVFAEKIGYGPGSTPDILDFAYGCLGGWLAYKVAKPTYVAPERVAEILATEPEDSRLRKNLEFWQLKIKKDKDSVKQPKSSGQKPTTKQPIQNNATSKRVQASRTKNKSRRQTQKNQRRRK